VIVAVAIFALPLFLGQQQRPTADRTNPHF
jgi:hypothetical protein